MGVSVWGRDPIFRGPDQLMGRTPSTELPLNVGEVGLKMGSLYRGERLKPEKHVTAGVAERQLRQHALVPFGRYPYIPEDTCSLLKSYQKWLCVCLLLHQPLLPRNSCKRESPKRVLVLFHLITLAQAY